MSPDRPRRRAAGRDAITRLDGSLTDLELVGLADELSQAGFVARAAAGTAAGPSLVFATDLRARLLVGYPISSPAVVGLPAAHRRRLSLIPAPRWTALGAAAALLLSVIGLNANLLRPAAPAANATAVSGATVVRDGQASALAVGTALRVGDEVRVGADGYATITLGTSEARLAGGADLRIDLVSAGRIVVDQIEGRVYHRVVVTAGTTYAVKTASLEWVARGTAFDLDRATADTGGRVRLTTVQHDVNVTGSGLNTTVAQGHQAVTTPGDDVPELIVGDVPESALHDPWLIANARIDAERGYPLGILDGMDLTESIASSPPDATPSARPSAAGPTPGTTPAPSDEPTTTEPTAITPAATPTNPPRAPAATPRPTPGATPRPTPRPTAKPTPNPTEKPTSDVESLSFAATACPGGVVLDWGAFGGDGFDHYLVLRSSSRTIPAAYPPQDGARGVSDSYTKSRSRTDGFDRTERAATVYYRAIAFGEDDRALAASVVRAVKTKPIKRLGEMEVRPDGSSTSFDWSPFAGSAGCYSSYKLAYSADDSTPSYLGGDAVAWSGNDPAVTSAWVDGLPAGTYWFRLQAIRATSLGKFVVAQSPVVKYRVP